MVVPCFGIRLEAAKKGPDLFNETRLSGTKQHFFHCADEGLSGPDLPTGKWIYATKFDGYRALALRGGGETRFMSRNKKDLGKKFPAIAESIAKLDVQDAIIDGEIVALDEKGRSSFQLLQGFDMGQERPPVFFYAFDLLRLNGKDLQNLPIEERKAKLEELLKQPPDASRSSNLAT